MQDINNRENLMEFSENIDLKEIIQTLLDGKIFILSIIVFFATLGVLYSLLLPNIYESKALLAPTENGQEPISNQSYANIANLTGVNIAQNVQSNALQAIEKIKSLSFFESYIMPNIFLPDLMASASWNSNSNIIEYNNNIYDIESNVWLDDSFGSDNAQPSSQQSFAAFKRKHLSIDHDIKTNFLTIRVKHQSPYIARDWAMLVVDQINFFYRSKDKEHAEKASNYLNSILITSKVAEINQVIASLLQQETQTLTLIEANEFYVFEYIDPPAVMEEKVEPQRALICILFTFFGGILGVGIVLARHYISREDLGF